MRKILIIGLLIFTGSLLSMEREEQEEISAEDVPLLQSDYDQLAHYIAAMVVVCKSKSDFYMRNANVTCCKQSFSFPKYICQHPFSEVEYVEFVKKNGQQDIGFVVRALKDDEDIDKVLKNYTEKTFTMYETFSHMTIDFTQLKKSIKSMLLEEQREFFKQNFQQLCDAPKLWMVSRILLLEWMRHLNSEPSVVEKCVEFCDHATSFGPGVCTGCGIMSCASGNIVLGALMMLLGAGTCLNFKGLCIKDLNFNCAEYWHYARNEKDFKLSEAINTLALHKISSNQ